jgi:hypothetical protein
LGYGLEFQQPIVTAEALAQAAIHFNEVGDFCLPPEALASKRGTTQAHVTLLELADRLRSNPRVLGAPQIGTSNNLINDSLVPRAMDVVSEVVSEFVVTPEDLDDRVAELIHTCIYITACAQWPGKIEMFDFFLLHCVNLSMFFPVFMDQAWLSKENSVRLVEWLGRTLLVGFAACRCPKLYEERVKQFQPRHPGGWDDIFRRAVAYSDDGHTAKLVRAIKSGEVSASKNTRYNTAPWVRLAQEDYLTIAHMVMDSVERMDDPSYVLPKLEWYVATAPQEIFKVADRFVRWCGFEEAWIDVPSKPARQNGSLG